MTQEGVDFSYGRPGGAALAAAGKRFAVRYITGAGKALTLPELKDLRAHNIAIGLVFESTRQRPLAGRAAGVIDAILARDASAELGIPTTRPIYFAVDWQATTAQYTVIDAYLRGAASVIGSARVGVYGHANLMDHCAAAGTARWRWQTYAWSGGRVSARAHLIQYRNGQVINGAAVDFCRSLVSDFGQWPAPSTNPYPGWGADVSIPIKSHFRASVVGAAIKKSGHSYGSVVNTIDIVAGLKTAGINYKTAVDPIDVQALVDWSRR